jgi:hypothetical protein
MNFLKKNNKLEKGTRNDVGKTRVTIVLMWMLSIIPSDAQEKNIETESVALDNLITFIVDHYNSKSDSTETKNITFLIETYSDNFNSEDKVILKQAFKLLSKRLSEVDIISIVTHSHFNGIALNQARATDIKKILHVIEYPKSNINSDETEGIELAYAFTKENFIEDSENSVVMIRMPNRGSEFVKTELKEVKNITSKKRNTVVLTAIALLPEIIALIKE